MTSPASNDGKTAGYDEESSENRRRVESSVGTPVSEENVGGLKTSLLHHHSNEADAAIKSFALSDTYRNNNIEDKKLGNKQTHGADKSVFTPSRVHFSNGGSIGPQP